MAEEVKKKPARKPRSRPTKGIAVSVWSVNGSPVPEKVVKEVEDAVQDVLLGAFNDGHRLLTQTTRA